MNTHITVPRALLANGFNGYSDQAQANKDALHKQGQTFLKKLAAKLGLQAGQFTVRSNKAGMAVSGEVTLHADHLYVQLSESFSGPGLQMMYRGCLSQRDYCGLNNQYAKMTDFADEDEQATGLRRMTTAMAQAKTEALHRAREAAALAA
jgi:hypothetical protein